jgi:hypothetical protein
VNIKIDNTQIEYKEKVKFLGVWITNSLTWDEHIISLSQKLNQSSYAIKILSNVLNITSLKIIYYSLFQSLLSYGIIFWGNTQKSQIIFKLQKRVIRTIAKAKHNEHCKPLFRSLNILPLPCLYVLHLLIYVKKHLLGVLTHHSDHHLYNTRNKNDFSVIPHSTALYEKGPKYAGTILYNKLPLSLKKIDAIPKFKTQLFQYLLENCFYSTEEYVNNREKTHI